MKTENIWIALAIGNSRYHWAWFLNTQLQSSWDTDYLAADTITQIGSADLASESCRGLFPVELQQSMARLQISLIQVPIQLISVVPSQTVIWQQLPHLQQITLQDIPLFNLYPNLGIDRALALFGGGEHYRYPILVIDAGTALTITGADRHKKLVGGAIIPGLRLQLQSLSSSTAGLPAITLPTALPSRWSNNTVEAIASGVLYTITAGLNAFILDWDRLYPESSLILTGGDGEIITKYLQSRLSEKIAERLRFDRQLLFHGFLAILNSDQSME